MTLTLPAKLRAKYRIDEGDSLTLVDLDGTILLAPKLAVVLKLAAEIERFRAAAGLEVEDLFSMPPSRRGKVRRASKRR